MTWTTIGIIWLVCGIVSAIWHISTDRYVGKILEHTPLQNLVEDTIVVILALAAGPVGLVIKIWETWFDPSNI